MTRLCAMRIAISRSGKTTRVTPMLSVALAVTSTVPLTVLAAAGAVTATPVGAADSSGTRGLVAASLVTAAGLPELVMHSTEEYESLALALACDPALMKTLRDRLAANRATAPLFDTARFTRNLEAAYLALLEKADPRWAARLRAGE